MKVSKLLIDAYDHGLLNDGSSAFAGIEHGSMAGCAWDSSFKVYWSRVDVAAGHENDNLMKIPCYPASSGRDIVKLISVSVVPFGYSKSFACISDELGLRDKLTLTLYALLIRLFKFFINKDGSAIYGSNSDQLHQVRTYIEGKLKIANDSLLHHDENGLPITGDNCNGWIGVSTLQALFILEHNAVCDTLNVHLHASIYRVNFGVTSYIRIAATFS
ncbi:hypothetical protein CTI12_AA477580 [Artemisia annua]|uniref:Heme peroxidase n=1 Tax=Artemisia annua TaxID=35608 RepID=A0A2U1LL15_ARTAN|nr:hypothetical protein CTI12_AA477580 [Artemisia annua]